MPKIFALSSKLPVGIQAVSQHPTPLLLALYSGTVSAGQSRFPSPAQDYEQEMLDLHQHVVTNPPATFFFTVSGDSMSGAGIFDGSKLAVDRSLTPKSGQIVLAVLDGELVVKRLYKRGAVVKLLSENPAYPPIVLEEAQECTVWGVVTYVITSTL
ncbi:MAG: S24 family peptidase [Pseudomonadota bacterium]